MEIPKQGIKREDIMSQLSAMKEGDLNWSDGRVMGFIYDPGTEVRATSSEAYSLFLTENGLDPTSFPSVHRLETEVVRMIANLLRGEESVVGNFTSGGTESNLCAVKAAREFAKHTRGIEKPEMIFPVTAHPSFHKAALYFGIKPIVTGIDRQTFKADVDEMRAAINENTILLIGSAPGYAQGVIDPIPEIAALAQEHDLCCHVDGCVGGIHLSFMRKAGYDVPEFDLSVPGVTSISTDLHKYGYAPKNASIVLHRNKDYRYHQIFSCIQTTTYALINPTIMSSKSAGPMAGSWATLMYLGEEGYIDIVRTVEEATKKMIDAINAMDGVHVLGSPDMCLFALASDSFNIFQLADEMKERGWYIQPQFTTPWSPPNVHITMHPGAAHQVDAFLESMEEAVAVLREGKSEPVDTAQIQAMVAQMLSNGVESAQEQLGALAGLSGSDLPDKLGLLNTVIDTLPDELSEHMLTTFMNDLYV